MMSGVWIVSGNVVSGQQWTRLRCQGVEGEGVLLVPAEWSGRAWLLAATGHGDPVSDVDQVLVLLSSQPHGLQHVVIIVMVTHCHWYLLILVTFPDSLVVISVNTNIFSPEVRELLWDLFRSNLLQLEDENTSDDDAEDVEDGQCEADQPADETLHWLVLREMPVEGIPVYIICPVSGLLQVITKTFNKTIVMCSFM